MAAKTLTVLYAGSLALILTTSSAFSAEPAADNAASETQTQREEFFEKRIRPVLVESCYSCHSASAKKLKGGLKLDSRDAILKGGDTGAAVVAGSVDESLLIEAIRYTDANLRMPPKAKLSDKVIADFETWVKMGAPGGHAAAPAAETAASKPDLTEARKYWAFQQPLKQPLPKVSQADWPKARLDSFIMVKLDEAGLKPSPRADARTLIRRATFDLTGLPPTPEDVEAFIKDKSPDAYARLIERLLNSPDYGESWARFWLDKARYADTLPNLGKTAGSPWLYRDWVVKAIQEDMPYDEFVKRQLATDLMPNTGPQDTPALGFLGLSPTYWKELKLDKSLIAGVVAEEWEEHMDALGRTFLGLTLACARCHDHKYDPISQEDYYAIAGVLASTRQCDRPLVSDAEFEPVRAAKAEMTDLQAEMQRLNRRGRFNQNAVAQAGGQKTDATKADEKKPDEDAVGAGTEKKPADAKSDEKKPAEAKPEAKKSEKKPIDIGANPDEAANNAAANNDNNDANNNDANKNDADQNDKKNGNAGRRGGDDPKARIAQIEERIKVLKATTPGLDQLVANAVSDAAVYVVEDGPSRTKLDYHPGEARDLHIMVRGSPTSEGPLVKRGFLAVLAPDHRKEFTHGSGRLELAEAIVTDGAPLSARVIVNRVWERHFGKGLVDTPSNFGTRGSRPTHPELLDDLTARFIENGWSLKWLHREIMLSASYQQSSNYDEAKNQIDPDNRLLWRMNRRRLDIEAWRDAMLAAAGNLDRREGGAPQELGETSNIRRTIYGMVNRSRLDDMLKLYDFPDPSLHGEQRVPTTTPVQQLFVLNSDFIQREAATLFERIKAKGNTDLTARVQKAYRWALSRAATPDEVTWAKEFFGAEKVTAEQEQRNWQLYLHVLLGSNEFAFVD